MGVDLFFVLSGFLITGVLLDSKHHALSSYFKHFYERRAKRILPAYVITLIVISFVFGFAWTHYWYFYILLTNLLLPLHIPHYAALDPLWSLAVEEQFYLIWPFAVFFLDKQRLRYLSIALIALAPMARGILHFPDHWPIYTLTPTRMDLLAAGGLLCILWRDRAQWVIDYGWRIAFPLVFSGLMSLFTLAHFGITTDGNTRIGNVLIYESSLFISLGFMLYALSGWHIGWLKNKLLGFIGKISYTMYLIHMTMLILTEKLFRSPILHATASLMLTVAYAALSWFLIERRLLEYRQTKVTGLA